MLSESELLSAIDDLGPTAFSGLSLSQTRRTLRNLAERGWARRYRGAVRDGHQLRGANLWQIVYTDDSLAALVTIPYQKFPMPPPNLPDMVPPQFWHLFWSGLQGSELRITEHAEQIGGAMIGSNALSAEAWALLNLPTDAIKTLHQARTQIGDANSPSQRQLAATIRAEPNAARGCHVRAPDADCHPTIEAPTAANVAEQTAKPARIAHTIRKQLQPTTKHH